MKRIVAIVMLGLTITGCGSQTADVLPTLIPSPQVASPATDTPVATAPPIQVEGVRPTLPPTWTPFMTPTYTPIPPTQTPAPFVTPIPPLAACNSFDVEREKSAATFVVGTPTQVYWSPVEGAVRYRILVLDAFNSEFFVDYAVDPTYIFKPDLFFADQRYAWKVSPEDSLGRQICLAVTGELSPG